ncbi:C4-dicarboxylate TRAP transporter substrate-binding protein [Roseitranquillus sediminis]|uniref:C4-dicarboxylate TRAP transporter substrate-binding protein n=1 Tax=Roseitranquillus sediminis TaxID=2809051 RepID=UPI001D0C8941|nr:C4-dicarboxylate TRAP transporter substrate-binding protein [Roseitranquillus sediminis]MBM9593867.1 C4-dicarboxylate TRAP transporter substrate-binding protein [Roseitranquillus sediminis]
MKITTLGAAALVLTGGLGQQAVAQDDIPNMTLRWAHFAPDAWGSAKAEQLFAKEIEERTDGKVKVQFFWNGSLGGPSELMEMVQTGAVDIASFPPTYYPAQWPMIGLTNSLPMTWDDADMAMDVQEYQIENNEAVQQELADNGLKVLLIHGLPPYRLQCTQPVRTMEDLEGLRIRTFGSWPPYVMEQIGAIPVSVTLGEVYEGLQRGSLDCGYNPVENAGFLKLYEVAPYWIDINFGAIAAYSTFTSQENWESWPDSLKQIVEEAYEVAVEYEKANFAPLAEQHLADAREAGAEVIEFEEQDKLEAMFPDMLGTWEQAMCDEGMCEEARSVVADTKRVMEEQQ